MLLRFDFGFGLSLPESLAFGGWDGSTEGRGGEEVEWAGKIWAVFFGTAEGEFRPVSGPKIGIRACLIGGFLQT